MPPLRARPGDLPTLARFFAESFGRSPWELSPALLADLARHDWPGNVRELRNVVERALSLGALGVDDELGGHRAAPAATPTLQASREAAAPMALKPPETWLEEIRALRSQGKFAEADRALSEFRAAYPDYRLPEDFR